MLKELKELKDKGNYYVTDWKSKGVYSSKLIPLYTTFLHDIKLSGYKKGIKFNKSVLVVKQNIYMPEIAYVLDDWPQIPINNFKLKNCLFRPTNTIKNYDERKYVYSGYGIAFDDTGL